MFWILGRVLVSGKCFWILGSVLDSGKCFWILGRVLDSGKCFGFWDVFCPYEPPYLTKLLLMRRGRYHSFVETKTLI